MVPWVVGSSFSRHIHSSPQLTESHPRPCQAPRWMRDAVTARGSLVPVQIFGQFRTVKNSFPVVTGPVKWGRLSTGHPSAAFWPSSSGLAGYLPSRHFRQVNTRSFCFSIRQTPRKKCQRPTSKAAAHTRTQKKTIFSLRYLPCVTRCRLVIFGPFFTSAHVHRMSAAP